jgi:hypothetical protein
MESRRLDTNHAHQAPMTHPDWAHLRAALIEAYGEPPHPITEQEIIAAYQQHPAALEKAAHQIAADHANGTIRSGWAVLRSRTYQLTTPQANPTRSTSIEREKALARAQQWTRNAGLHYDRWPEIEDELYNERGLLHHYPETIAAIHDFWDKIRPQGEAIEADALERAAAWKQQQTRIPWNRRTLTKSDAEPKPL